MKPMTILTPLLLLALATAAPAGVGEIYADATLAYTGPGLPILYCNPDGSGNPFTAARLPDGAAVDVTITLELRDLADIPISGYPAEDIWLETQGGGLAPCQGGTTADAATDAAGLTLWAAPLLAGGWDAGPTLVLVSGSPIMDGPLNLGFNSADNNGDGLVNLVDVGNFTEDFYGIYSLRSDLLRDGVINLGDLGKLAQAIGGGCD